MQTSFSNLDEALQNPSNVRELNLEGQELKALPDSIGTLVNLEKLYLARNDFGARIPEALWTLQSLKFLDLQCISMSRIPDGLGRLGSLEELRLGGFDKFEELPASMKALIHLRRLDICEANRLVSLPDWFWELPALDTLVLNQCKKLQGLREGLAKMQRLSKLELQLVPLDALPDTMGGFADLKELSIGATKIGLIPDWIGDLRNLEELTLDDNPNLKALPEAMGNLKKLRKLWVSQDGQELFMPQDLAQLEGLRDLYIHGCELCEFPGWILNLKDLRRLSLNLEGAPSIPKEIAALSKLERLELVVSPELKAMHDEIASWLTAGCVLEM